MKIVVPWTTLVARAVAAVSVDVGRTTMLVPRTDEATLEARLDKAVESEMTLLSALTVS